MHPLRARAMILLPTLVLALTYATGSIGARAADATIDQSGRIVPWYAIGGVAIGESRTRVEYAYGPGTTDTRYSGVRFAAPEGALILRFEVPRIGGGQERVGMVATYSPSYRTPGGIHVGTKIPLGPCHHVQATPVQPAHCDYRYRGFHLEGSSWRRESSHNGIGISAFMDVKHGYVTMIRLMSAQAVEGG